MKNVISIALLYGVMAAGCTSTAGNSYRSESYGIFSYNVGQFEVYLLVESQRDGNAGILVNAGADVLDKYIPQEGFKHTANAILVKAKGQNILIDSGTGAGGVIIEKIKKLGVQSEEVNAVLITHLHGDHFGSLQSNGQANFPNAKVYLSSKEHEFFTSTNPNQGAIAALAPYQSNIETFEPAALGGSLKELLPGISPIAAYGHTPGHTLFQIENGGSKFLIIGDLLHVALVQFPVPEISATYDMDQSAAAAVRRQVLDYAAKNKIPIAGMHIVYPGMGDVAVDGSGFSFAPK
jgi:glyoxylase-like metal-dependent hydrolase (beta-lactamase superfamily II)